MQGRVVDLGRRCCFVDIGDRVIEVALKGTLVKQSRFYSGDLVTVEMTEGDLSSATVAEMHPRARLLLRPAIANIDQILFVNCIEEPPLDLEIVDRCLFSAHVAGVDSVLLFNKHDLLDEEELGLLAGVRAIYERLGLVTEATSAQTGLNVDRVKKLCAGKISSLAGPSGAGKSALLSRIFPDRVFVTNEVSVHTERGRHTTTATTLLKLPAGGYIADTPGFSLMDLPLIDESEVINHFPDLLPAVGRCKFNNCIHADDPGCYVQEMLEKGDVAQSRYWSYRRFYEEMKQKRVALYR